MSAGNLDAEDWGEDPLAGRRSGAPDLIVFVAFFLFVALLGLGVFIQVSRSSSSVEATDGDAAEGTAAADEGDGTDGDDEAAAPTTASTAATDTTQEATTSTTEGSTTMPAMPGQLVGLYDEGQVTLIGQVPSEEAAFVSIIALEDLFGEGAVARDLEIDPTVGIPDSVTIRFTDAVFFAPGAETIEGSVAPVFQQVVDFLNLYPDVTLLVEGHTDNDGDELRNLALSQARAEAARDFLLEQGIEQFRVEAFGRGDTEPVADNATSSGRAQNRRIEFEVLGLRLG
ncbi:MAG: OmpA family protein [Actinomycetota bacterium]